MAVASTETSGSCILIYYFDSGEQVATLSGHVGIVYSIDWSSNDKILLSVSSDGTARIWEFQSDGSVSPTQIFPHPSYVYTGLVLTFTESETYIEIN